MPVTFHYNASGMLGADLHKMNTPFDPFVAGPIMFSHLGRGRTSTVTADGEPMIQKGFENLLVEHTPLVPPASAAAAALWALTFAGSSTKPFLSVASVQGEGKPLACSMFQILGRNMDCCAPVSLPAGNTVSFCSVITEPTLADWVISGIDAAVGMIIGYLLGEYASAWSKQFKEAIQPIVAFVLKQAWKWVVKPYVIDPFSKPLGKEFDKLVDTVLT